MRKLFFIVAIVGLTWGLLWAEEKPAQQASTQEGLAEVEVSYQEHTVVPGDTLWDLAGHYLGDPFRWPEIWQLNTDIVEDPHWIYPGQVLKIRELKRAAKKPVVIQPTPMPIRESVEPEMTFVIPPEVVARETTFKYRVQANLIDYISTKKVKSKGEIVEVWDDARLLGQGEKFYFTYDEPLKQGDTLALFRTEEKVSDPYGDKKMGYIVDFVGQLRVTNVETVKKNTYYTGEIENSSSDAEIDDKLMNTEPKVVEVVANPAKVDKSGFIVASSPGSGAMLGQGDFCFINLGADEGIEVGNTFLVYKSSTIEPKRHPRYLVGQLIVIRVAETSSTALITYSAKPITVGDMVKTELP